MFTRAKKSVPGELVQGTLDMLILKTLSRGALHGYAIAEFIQRTSEDVLRVEEGRALPGPAPARGPRACWRRSGARRTTTAARSSTG